MPYGIIGKERVDNYFTQEYPYDFSSVNNSDQRINSFQPLNLSNHKELFAHCEKLFDNYF